MSTATVEAVDHLELLLDEAVRCAFLYVDGREPDQCTSHAEWLLIYRNGFRCPACTEHKDETVKAGGSVNLSRKFIMLRLVERL